MENFTKDLSVTLQDKPGTLFKACDAIAKQGINIEGFSVVPEGKHGIFHVLTADPVKTRRSLEGAGFTITEENDAFVVELQDRPGALASLLRPIADAELNLGTTYSLTQDRVAFVGRNAAQIRDVVREAMPAAARS